MVPTIAAPEPREPIFALIDVQRLTVLAIEIECFTARLSRNHSGARSRIRLASILDGQFFSTTKCGITYLGYVKGKTALRHLVTGVREIGSDVRRSLLES